MKYLQTPRLILRRWKQFDIPPFAAINADPKVMEFFLNTLSTEQTSKMVEKIEASFESTGFGLWAVEIIETSEFIGFVGLNQPEFKATFTPCVEVGWRLCKKHWGKGFAVEAAKEAVRDGFERIGLTEIVSFTAKVNTKSIKVMEKIGMKRNPDDDFMHPLIDEGHPLKPHVLYRLGQEINVLL